MNTPKNAAREAVKAAALPGALQNTSKNVAISANIAMVSGTKCGKSQKLKAQTVINTEQQTASNPGNPLVAVKAVSLPSVQQFMRLACEKVAAKLSQALSEACQIENWCEGNTDPVDTAELALVTVEGLAKTLNDAEAHDVDAFNRVWWLTASAVRLARDSFLDKETPAWRCLSNAVGAFEVLGSTLEFLSFDHQAQKGSTV